MVITLEPDLVAALNDLASKQGVAPETLAIGALRQKFLAASPELQLRDEWERRLLAAATNCDVALSNEAVSSEGLYE